MCSKKGSHGYNTDLITIVYDNYNLRLSTTLLKINGGGQIVTTLQKWP